MNVIDKTTLKKGNKIMQTRIHVTSFSNKNADFAEAKWTDSENDSCSVSVNGAMVQCNKETLECLYEALKVIYLGQYKDE